MAALQNVGSVALARKVSTHCCVTWKNNWLGKERVVNKVFWGQNLNNELSLPVFIFIFGREHLPSIPQTHSKTKWHFFFRYIISEDLPFFIIEFILTYVKAGARSENIVCDYLYLVP